MDIVRDVLDVEVVDLQGRVMGRADGLWLEIRDGAPPRVVTMELGILTLLRRIAGWLSRLVERVGRSWGVPVDSVQLPVTLVSKVDIDIKIDIDPDTRRALLAGEHWVRDRIVAKVPGAGK